MTGGESDQDGEEPPIDYENQIGPGHPPKHSRWQKGYCPNRSGRPRKDRSRRHFLVQVAFRKIEATDGPKRRKMTVIEALVLIIKAKAIGTGHVAASRMFEKLHGFDVGQDEPPIPRGILIMREMSHETWEEMAADHLRRQEAATTAERFAKSHGRSTSD